MALINRENKALVADCNVRMGEIVFGRVFNINSDADKFIKEGIWFDNVYKKGRFYGQTYGPQFSFLSESLQN